MTAISPQARPGIDRLLVESALEPELRRRLQESPDEVFPEFDLSEYEKEVLRRPDHRLLDLLGAALARQQEAARGEAQTGRGAAADLSPKPAAERQSQAARDAAAEAQTQHSHGGAAETPSLPAAGTSPHGVAADLSPKNAAEGLPQTAHTATRDAQPQDSHDAAAEVPSRPAAGSPPHGAAADLSPKNAVESLPQAAHTESAQPEDLCGADILPPPLPASKTPLPARTLPDTLVALTVIPCFLRASGQITYVVWVNPMTEGADPAALPQPAAGSLPGEPLAPLHSVIQISAQQSQDAAGNLQVGLWASFRRSTNIAAPPPPETAADPEASPFGSPLDSGSVKAAAAAVRAAAPEERYRKLAGLMRELRQGDVR